MNLPHADERYHISFAARAKEAFGGKLRSAALVKAGGAFLLGAVFSDLNDQLLHTRHPVVVSGLLAACGITMIRAGDRVNIDAFDSTDDALSANLASVGIDDAGSTRVRASLVIDVNSTEQPLPQPLED